jgi:hypothetical protein
MRDATGVAATGSRAAAAGLALLLAACEPGDRNFSQYPGFAEYYAANPPAATAPDAEDRALLARFRPRFFKADGEDGPVDFYADYVARGRFVDGGAGPVTRAELNARKDDPGAVLAHEPAAGGGRAPSPVAYGRVDRERLEAEDLVFLTYNLAFAASGLPDGLPRWQERLVRLVADPRDWHQLDHYTAVTIVLEGATEAPVAAVFQQHNSLRTWLFGPELPLPADGRLKVALARRSNELYPWAPEERRWRTVGIPDANGMAYLMSGAPRPWLVADDVTEPGAEVDYRLDFLPPADAFYRFAGYLGERRRLPGRDGPPGADYNTLPELKPRVQQMLAGFWRERDPGDMRRLAATWGAGQPVGRFAEAQAPVFLAAWRCARGEADACADTPGG